MLAGMELRKSVLTDLDARTSGSRSGLQLNNVRNVGKNFWRELRRDGIDKGLARMIWMDGIGDDRLAGMKSVGAFARRRFAGIGPRDGLGFAAGICSVGKSTMGPDQSIRALSKAALCRTMVGGNEIGATRKTMCQSAAARTARLGMRRSTQQSRK